MYLLYFLLFKYFYLNMSMNFIPLGNRGEYRSRTDDLLRARQAL